MSNLDSNALEALCRAMCAADGIDPDLDSIISMQPVTTMPAWKKQIPRARAALDHLAALPSDGLAGRLLAVADNLDSEFDAEIIADLRAAAALLAREGWQPKRECTLTFNGCSYPQICDELGRCKNLPAVRTAPLIPDSECPDCGATTTNIMGFACEHERCPIFNEKQEPCPVCGNEERGQGGYLSCECPARPAAIPAAPIPATGKE